MRIVPVALAAACALVAPASVWAQQTTAPRQQFQTTTSLTPNRDVVLEVPELAVDSIGLTVRNVRAKVSLAANAMNLVTINAGIDVGIKEVQLGIVGVFAEAYLYADLDNVARIVERVVQTLDRNPQILIQVLKAVETGVTSLTAPLTPRR